MPKDAELIAQIDASLERFVLSRELPVSLLDAVHYAVFGGGKRVRPVICLRACLAVGGQVEAALAGACALELIHTFSLVHDDLPAMDDDNLRRGRATLHKHTNEAMAILAGDAMTTLAFEMIVQRVEDPAVASRLCGLLAEATNRMIAGQVYDTMGGHDQDLDALARLKVTHRCKTGALLRAAVLMGAACGQASDEQIASLDRYAEAIGLMFQAVDDLLDVTQTSQQMGKATGKDADAGKLTYPGLLGIDGTRDAIESLRQQAVDALTRFDSKADPLRDMANRLAARQS